MQYLWPTICKPNETHLSSETLWTFQRYPKTGSQQASRTTFQYPHPHPRCEPHHQSVTSWLSLPNPATPVLPSRCVSNLNMNGSTDSVRTYPMALMLWTEDVIFTPTLCRTPLFLTPCFMGLVGAIDITSSQSFITLRDNGSLLINHASTPPMGKFLSCSKSFLPRAPPADPTVLISWRGIALGFQNRSAEGLVPY